MKLTIQEKEEIYEMYLSGNYHLKEIAEWIGCSVVTIVRTIEYKTKEKNKKKGVLD